MGGVKWQVRRAEQTRSWADMPLCDRHHLLLGMGWACGVVLAGLGAGRDTRVP